MRYTFKNLEAMMKEIRNATSSALYKPFENVDAAIKINILRSSGIVPERDVTLIEVGTINNEGKLIKDLSIEICSSEYVILTNEKSEWKYATMRVAPDSLCVTDEPIDCPAWIRTIDVHKEVYQFLLDVVKSYNASKLIPPNMQDFDERPLTFGEFVEFCKSVRDKRNVVGVYKPFKNLDLCLHIYDTGAQVNFARLDNTGFAMAKVAFLFLDDVVKVCRVSSGRTIYDLGIEYDLDAPFCFGTKEAPVQWYKNVGMSGREYEFFRDMLGPFHAEACA